jgi:hypothetical protein
MKRVFLSCENPADPQFIRLKEALQSQRFPVFSCPAHGDKSREDWYQDGCNRALKNQDLFVAVITEGYDCSTWMAHELETAWKLFKATGKPRLFAFRVVSRPLPAGFHRYEADLAELPSDTAAAAMMLAGEG